MNAEKLNEQLKQLNDFVVKSNESLDVAEQSINLSMDAALVNIDENDRKKVQSQMMQIKMLLNKAKKGKNIDKEVKQFTKNIKNAGTNKK